MTAISLTSFRAATLFAFVAATNAFGQTPSTAATAEDKRASMEVYGTVAQAYDDDVPLALASTLDPSGLSLGGPSTQLTGGLNYSWQMGRVRAGTTLGSSIRHYSRIGEFRAINHSGGAGLTAQLSRRTELFVNQTAMYSPSYLYGLFPQVASTAPGSTQPIAPDYFINDFESMSYTTSASLTQAVTRRSSVSISGDLVQTRFADPEARNRNLKTAAVGGRYSRSMTRNTSIQASYRYREGNFGYGGLITGATTDVSNEHVVEAGFVTGKALSSTRRLTFSAGIGTSLVHVPVLPEFGDDNMSHTASGHASLSYPMGRGWKLDGAYRRGVEYVAGLTEPVLTNGALAGATGRLTRKLELSLAAGYSTGDSALVSSGLQFDTYTGSTRLGYALSRRFTVFGEYLYYFYDFRDSVELPSSVPVGLERTGVRGGLSMRFPILPTN